MKHYLIAATMLTSFSAFAMNSKVTLCTHHDQERKIEVYYPESTPVPCEVQYTKAGSMSVLWNANAQEGYCEEKAAAFVEKQIGWGWSCKAVEPEVEEKSEEVETSEEEESVESDEDSES